MFLRSKVRRKDGKQHRYWSIVENTRVAGGRVVQRHVLLLGEINDSPELAWRRSIEVLEDGETRPQTLSLFPEDRCDGLLADASIVRVKLAELRLSRPRQWGACWLAPMLWRELELDVLWGQAAGSEPQGDALEKSPVRAGRLPPAGTGKRGHGQANRHKCSRMVPPRPVIGIDATADRRAFRRFDDAVSIRGTPLSTSGCGMGYRTSGPRTGIGGRIASILAASRVASSCIAS
jgi:hypothetical protein